MNIALNHRLGSRNAQRWRVDTMIDARDGDGHQRARVTDISVSGLQLQTLSRLRMEQRLWVKLGNIEALETTVVWVDGFSAGCTFANPLAEYVLEHILKNAEGTKVALIDRRAVRRP